MTLHAQVIPPHDHDGLLRRIEAYLLKHYQIGHVTIQMEYQHCDTPDCGINRAPEASEHTHSHSHLGHHH